MPQLAIKRIYEPRTGNDGCRVLVDRIWPRGLSKAKAGLDVWAKDLAPSAELRKWFGHDPDKWDEFVKRYQAELSERRDGMRDLLVQCRKSRLTLLYAARDTEHNQALVLKAALEKMQSGT